MPAITVQIDDESAHALRRLAAAQHRSETDIVRQALADMEAKSEVKDRRFKELASAWKAETRLSSNVTTKAMHPAYQKIIGMGEEAVPFILEDLRENGPNDWFWALTVITDANPITNEIAGNMAAMTEAWLQWGSKAGLLDGCRHKTNNASPIVNQETSA